MFLISADDGGDFSGLVALALMAPAFTFMWLALRRQKKQSGQVERALENERRQIALSERSIELLESIDRKLDQHR